MEQEPSIQPIVELTHGHIHKLRSITEMPSLRAKLAHVHSAYLRNEYDLGATNHATVDDLDLTEYEVIHIGVLLNENKDELPIDVLEHLRSEFDHYHQIKFRNPREGEHIDLSEWIIDGRDDSDDDIIVADGGVCELTDEEQEALESLVGEGEVKLETDYDGRQAHPIIDGVKIKLPVMPDDEEDHMHHLGSGNRFEKYNLGEFVLTKCVRRGEWDYNTLNVTWRVGRRVATDGGVDIFGNEHRELTAEEREALDSLVGEGYTPLETVWEGPAGVADSTRYLRIDNVSVNLSNVVRCENTDRQMTRSRPHYTYYTVGEYRITCRVRPSRSGWLDKKDVQWKVERRVATDGGVDTVQSSSLPELVAAIMRLNPDDHVVFEVHGEEYAGTVSSYRWTTTEGRPDSCGYEVVTASIHLESPESTPFENELISLHAARPLDGYWPDSEPVVIDTMDADFGELEDLQVAASDDLWLCGYCEKRSYAPDTSRPTRGRQSMEMRVTCPHCGKTDLVEWR